MAAFQSQWRAGFVDISLRVKTLASKQDNKQIWHQMYLQLLHSRGSGSGFSDEEEEEDEGNTDDD